MLLTPRLSQWQSWLEPIRFEETPAISHSDHAFCNDGKQLFAMPNVRLSQIVPSTADEAYERTEIKQQRQVSGSLRVFELLTYLVGIVVPRRGRPCDPLPGGIRHAAV